MKIRCYENLVIFFDIFFGILLFTLTTFAYFLGFRVNINTLPYYFIALFLIFSLVVITYMVYRLLCKTYIIFTKEEVVKEKKGKTSILIKYKDILSLKHYNVFNLLIGDAKGGNLVIEFLDGNNELSYIYLPISNKNIQSLKANGYINL